MPRNSYDGTHLLEAITNRQIYKKEESFWTRFPDRHDPEFQHTQRMLGFLQDRIGSGDISVTVRPSEARKIHRYLTQNQELFGSQAVDDFLNAITPRAEAYLSREKTKRGVVVASIGILAPTLLGITAGKSIIDYLSSAYSSLSATVSAYFERQDTNAAAIPPDNPLPVPGAANPPGPDPNDEDPNPPVPNQDDPTPNANRPGYRSVPIPRLGNEQTRDQPADEPEEPTSKYTPPEEQTPGRRTVRIPREQEERTPPPTERNRVRNPFSDSEWNTGQEDHSPPIRRPTYDNPSENDWRRGLGEKTRLPGPMQSDDPYTHPNEDPNRDFNQRDNQAYNEQEIEDAIVRLFLEYFTAPRQQEDRQTPELDQGIDSMLESVGQAQEENEKETEEATEQDKVYHQEGEEGTEEKIEEKVSEGTKERNEEESTEQTADYSHLLTNQETRAVLAHAKERLGYWATCANCHHLNYHEENVEEVITDALNELKRLGVSEQDRNAVRGSFNAYYQHTSSSFHEDRYDSLLEDLGYCLRNKIVRGALSYAVPDEERYDAFQLTDNLQYHAERTSRQGDDVFVAWIKKELDEISELYEQEKQEQGDYTLAALNLSLADMKINDYLQSRNIDCLVGALQIHHSTMEFAPQQLLEDRAAGTHRGIGEAQLEQLIVAQQNVNRLFELDLAWSNASNEEREVIRQEKSQLYETQIRGNPLAEGLLDAMLNAAEDGVWLEELVHETGREDIRERARSIQQELRGGEE